jgi:hypothetical protein
MTAISLTRYKRETTEWDVDCTGCKRKVRSVRGTVIEDMGIGKGIELCDRCDAVFTKELKLFKNIIDRVVNL